MVHPFCWGIFCHRYTMFEHSSLWLAIKQVLVLYEYTVLFYMGHIVNVDLTFKFYLFVRTTSKASAVTRAGPGWNWDLRTHSRKHIKNRTKLDRKHANMGHKCSNWDLNCWDRHKFQISLKKTGLFLKCLNFQIPTINKEKLQLLWFC